jgi:hypothetical protein
MLRWPALLALVSVSNAALADAPIVVSKAPDAVAVTFYRDGGRSADEAIPFDPEETDEEGALLGGFAMIAETRTVDIPPGESVVRFEGVAGGIVPESAMLFNGDLKEKNFDGRLLSQRGLIDAYSGQKVTIRRINDVTGKEEVESATILSQPDAIVLKTSKGYEAAACTGTMETLLFPAVPKDLTAKPTLSMTTRPDSPGGRMTLTLAYLANNFDWQANYVGTFSPDGQRLELTGWLTLASRDRTSFLNAEVSAIAGEVAEAESKWEKEERLYEERDNDPYSADNIDLNFTCWPYGTTGYPPYNPVLFGPGSLPDKSKPIYVSYDYGYGGGGCSEEDEEGGCMDEIVVTGTRIAVRSDVGDLKLYTVPFATDVPSKNMKQVRFMAKRELKGETLYRAKYSAGDNYDDPEFVFQFTNDKASGAGEPFPKGQIALFQQTERGRQLVGESSIDDKTVDEEVQIKLPEDFSDIDLDVSDTDKEGEGWQEREMELENGYEFPVTVEIEMRDELDWDMEYKLSRFSKRVARKDGAYIWRVKLDPEEKASIKFRVTEREVPVYDDGD